MTLSSTFSFSKPFLAQTRFPFFHCASPLAVVALDEIAIQTDCVQLCPCCRKRELEVQALSLAIQNDFVPNPEIDAGTDGLACFINKDEVEDILFRSYHRDVPSRQKRLSEDDWNGIQWEWYLRQSCAPSTFMSYFSDLEFEVKNVAMWYYGIPVCVAFNRNRGGWGIGSEFFCFDSSVVVTG